MWVPVGGNTVRLSSGDPSDGGGIKLSVGEARRLVLVLAFLTGRWSLVADLRRSLTIARARRDGNGAD